MTDYGDLYGLGKAHAVENLTVQQAIERLRKALKTDPSYRESWKANIAMAFYDEIDATLAPPSMPRDRLLQFCNRAADRFLQQLEKE